MKRFRLPAAIALTLLVFVACASVAEACPTCKAALASSGDKNGIVTGFFWSILFMMSMPFLLLTGFSTYLYVLVRRAKQAEAAVGAPPLSPVSELVEA